MSRPVRVLFVCLGNICRSPMAEGLLLLELQRRGVEGRFEVESAGTAAYHVGELADRRTRALLERRGLKLRSRARQVCAEDFAHFDAILAMDSSNLRDLEARCPSRYRAKLHRVLEPIGGGDVPDPYYGGPDGFDLNAAQLDAALTQWLERWLSDGAHHRA